MKAIILAGGKGSRLQPLTDTLPKPLLPVGGIPILDRIIQELPDAIDEVIVITKYLEEKIISHIAEKVAAHAYRPIVRTISQGAMLGTYGSLFSIKDQIAQGERFLVLGGDDLHTKSELTPFLEYPLAFGIQKRVMPAYYASIPDKDGIMRRFRPQTDIEKADGTYIATGVYVFDDRIFSFEPKGIEGGEYGLPQTAIAHTDTYPLHAVVTTAWQPINNFKDLDEANALFL